MAGVEETVGEASDRRFGTATRMRRFGGGFVKALGAAYELADANNAERIEKAFPEYMDRYGAKGQFAAAPLTGES